MLMKKASLSTQGLSLYLEGDKGIVFHHHTRTLYQLSTLSITFFLAIDEGLSQAESIAEISELTKIPSEKLVSTYQQTLMLFQLTTEDINYLDGQYLDIKSYEGSHRLSAIEACTFYQVGDVCFGFSAENKDVVIAIANILRPIKVARRSVDFHINACVSATKNDTCYEVSSNNLTIEKELSLEQIIPVVIDHIQVLAFQMTSYLFCFHGAALKMASGNVWLPGKSGAGKSTLSAVLAAEKHALYSDEMIIVDRNFRIRALELPIAIKSGSWDLLSEQYPELIHESSWQRIDGRRLKYVWPKHFSNIKDEEIKDENCLIFCPTYCKKSTSDHRKKLSVIETIAQLIDGGYQVGVELNEKTVELFIEFIEKAQCYQYTYHKTEQAEDQIESLWRLYDKN